MHTSLDSSYFPGSCWPFLLLGTPLANVLVPVCLQALYAFSRAALQLVFFSFLVARRKVIFPSFVWNFAFVCWVFCQSSCWSSPPACWEDRPALKHSDWSFPHFGVLCKPYNQALRNLFWIADRHDQRKEKTAFWGEVSHLLPSSRQCMTH